MLVHGQGRPHLAMSKAGENVEDVRLGEERGYRAEDTGRDVLPRQGMLSSLVEQHGSPV